MPRFDQSFSGLCEQNLQDTLQLKQRYLDAKAKRAPKSKDKKTTDSIQSSVHVQQKFLKRSAEEHDPGGQNETFEPPVKLQCTTQQHGTHQNEGLTKFSVEIVQQLEFTTSAASSQPQQISTNVTVKTHANASVKSDVSSPKSNPSTPASTMHQKSNIGLDVGALALVECVKQEPDNDFADLDQCAAALEKDAAANGGAGFGGFPDLIGDDTNDEIISSATFNDLISDISNYPDYELMKDFDFEDKSEVVNSNNNNNNMKVEDIKDVQSVTNNGSSGSGSADNVKNIHSPLIQNQNNYSPPVFDNQSANKSRIPPYSNMDFPKTELSPAAQTLKQMAEQHNKNQMGLSFNPNSRIPTARSPYPDFQFQGEYGSPNSNSNYHKNSPGFPQPDVIKQEMIFQGNEYDMKRKPPPPPPPGMYKQQQYSPYSSPSASSHGSPGYLPRTGSGPNAGSGPYGGGTPPRPPSGPGGGNNVGASVQINQAQQLNISQSHGHTIQVSAGQHVHLTGDLKGSVSIAAQQGMHFSQHANQNGTAQTQSTTNTQPSPSPMSTPQHQNSPVQSNLNSPNPMNPSNPQMNQPSPQMNPTLMSGGQHVPGSLGAQMMGSGMSASGGIPVTGNLSAGGMPGAMPSPNMGVPTNSANTSGGNMGGPGGMAGPGMSVPGGMAGPGGMSGGMGGNVGNGMGGMQHPGMQHVGGMPDTYSLSQTQTINFTQQTLRRAGGPGVPNPMGPTGPMPGQPTNPTGNLGPRLLNAQTIEQQKLLHQQHLLRAQQQAAMQQQMVRPPPPEYKPNTTGMIPGMQSRYAAGPPQVRRMVHQPMPPSGPMIRSSMYMLQQQQHQQHQQHQQQMPQRPAMYARQQAPMGGIDSMQHNSSEWRHLLMTQQQNTNFNTVRPTYQQGFNMNSGNMQQMSVLQHQQLRSQQGAVSGGMTGNHQGLGQNQMLAQSNNPMAQMNNMNQAMLHMQQQQQQSLMQQHNSHMSMSSIHMQQSQSLTITNPSIPQQQNTISNAIGNNPPNNQNNALGNFNAPTDFNFEFLDNLTGGDAGAFTDQELLNSFDSDAGFNLDF